MKRGSKPARFNDASPPSPPQQPDVRRFNQFRICAYLGILAVFCILAVLNDFKSMWAPPATLHEVEPYAARVVLFTVLMLLAVRWVIATDREFKLWTRVLENPAEKREVYVAIVALSLILGFCLAFAFDIVKISLAFTVYLLINYWSQWLSNDHFARALPETRRNSSDANKRKVLDVMERYWLKKAQLARITTMMFFSSLAFSLAWAGSFEKEPQKRWFQLSATTVLIVNIIVGEIVIAVWRYKRDRGIAQAGNSKTPVLVQQPTYKLVTESYKGRIDTARTAAYWGILVVFGIVATLNDFKSIWVPSAWSRTGLFVTGIVLFLELAVLAYRWVLATSNEMELWLEWLENPMTKRQVQAAIISLALVLGILLAFAHDIVLISAFMSAYFLVNYWTQWLSNDHFRRALERTRESSLNATKRKVLSIMEEYWLMRPQMARITTMMFFALMAFSLALAGWVHQEPQKSHFYLVSYTVLFLDILIGEIVIFMWRRKRDNKIEEATQPKE